jgi:hypothetical protein
VIVGGLAVGGIAYASIPDSSQVFHACYKTNGGQVRLVDSASACTASETATQWSQTGPSGPSGASGPSGPQGPGATWGTKTVAELAGVGVLATTNAISLFGQCPSSGVSLSLHSEGDTFLDVSGTRNAGQNTSPVDVVGETHTEAGGASEADLDVIARNTTGGDFVHIDLHGSKLPDTDCKFWWVIIPASP